MKTNSECCQLKRMLAGWSANAITICVLAGSFTGCTTLQSNDSQISDEERHIKQAEIKASLVTGDENIEQENTNVEKSALMDKTNTQETTEIDETPTQVIFDSGDLSRYVADASDWLGDVFSWSDSAVVETEPETAVVILKPKALSPTTVQTGEAALESHSHNTNTPLESSQKLAVVSSERLDNEQSIEISAPLDADIPPIVEDVITAEAPVLVTELLLDNNENLITAINSLTTENPSAAGISIEAMDQQARARIKRENAIIKPSSQPLRNSTAGNSQALKVWQGCAVSTPTIELDSPGYTTQMWLNVFDDRLMVNATTNIDITMKQVGIKVDNGKLQKFSSKLYASNVVWSADMHALIKNHHSLTIFIGGDELGRNRQAAEVSMAELKELYLANTNCSS
jgi:hypothetical protein